MINITADGNYQIHGISPGRQFTLAASGTFASGVVTAQYATAEPVAATLTLDDDQAAEAIVLTAVAAGTGWNDLSFAVVDPAAADSALSISQDGLAFEVSAATGAGDAATVQIGAGANGVVTVTNATAGTAGNLWDISVVAGTGASQPMSAIVSGAYARKRIVVTLGTDSNGDADATKNTATLIAAAIHALADFTATASGTGASTVATQAAEAFTGGGANAAVTTTVGELLSLLQTSPIVAPHFTAALAGGGDEEAIIATVADTNFASGTAGTFAGFTTAVSFSAAGDKTARNCGINSTINLSVASSTGSTDINIIPTEIAE